MKGLHMVSYILLFVGGLNWGLVAIGNFMGADWNVVHMLLGSWPMVESAVYLLVGLAAAYALFEHPKTCTMCKGKMGGDMGGMKM